MTKERLKQLKALKKEAEHLEEQIRDLPFRTGPYVADSAKDYRTGFPRTILIQGYSTEEYDRLKRKLQKKLQTINVEVLELESWLDGVDDAELRDILRLQYINGMTQEEVAEELGYSVITVKRRLKKFWNDKSDTE